jgi:hypothetical protein
MKRHLLLGLTLLSLGATGMMWLRAEAPARRPLVTAHRSPAGTARPGTISQDQIVRHWLQGQPRHWRDCLLHR